MSVMAGWTGSSPAGREGQLRTPEAWRQWWADWLGIRQAEWGSAGSPRLFYSPEVESSGERFRPEKLSPEEDPRTSTKGGLQRAGISPRTTMLQGVDQPCWIRGSRGCGPALPSVVTRLRRRRLGRQGRGLEDEGGGHWRGAGPLQPPKRRRQRFGIGHLQPCAGSGRLRRRRRRRPSLEGRVRAADGRQERRGLDEGRNPPPLEQREGHPEPAINASGGPRERERPAG
jgi:hypothetical protein